MDKMTKRQSWAIRCACGLDARTLVDVWTYDAASQCLDHLNSTPERREKAIHALTRAGAVGKAKAGNRDDEFAAAWNKAVAAGVEAGQQIHAAKYVIAGQEDRYEPFEACGFAWISFAGNTAFGRWAKKTVGARKGYPTGLQVSIHDFSQSYERKSAMASKMAEVLGTELNLSGIYAGGRLD